MKHCRQWEVSVGRQGWHRGQCGALWGTGDDMGIGRVCYGALGMQWGSMGWLYGALGIT